MSVETCDLVTSSLASRFPGFELMRRRHRRSKTKYSGHKDCPELADENMSVEVLKPGEKPRVGT